MSFWVVAALYLLVGISLDAIFMTGERIPQKRFERRHPGYSIKKARVALLLFWPIVVIYMIIVTFER